MTSQTHADQLPEHDVVGILLRQHARIAELLTHVRGATGEHRRQTFDEVRALLAAHETAEEMVLRPFTALHVGQDVAEAHNTEEKHANQVLADLEKLDADDPEFEALFTRFQGLVLAHAEHEERAELPFVEVKASAAERARMGRALLAAEAVAPTHPHPSTAGSPAAQWAVGPIASIVDRARDAVRAANS